MNTHTPARSTVTIVGNTFPHRDTFKALGGRWNATVRGWEVPADRAAKALALPGCYDVTMPSGRAAAANALAVSRVAAPVKVAAPRARRWQPCGYPGCSPGYCDACA